jgi:hypothetical protein
MSYFLMASTNTCARSPLPLRASVIGQRLMGFLRDAFLHVAEIDVDQASIEVGIVDIDVDQRNFSVVRPRHRDGFFYQDLAFRG